MNYVDKGSKGFEKLLIAVERQCKNDTVGNRKWVKLWGSVADYRYYKIKKYNFLTTYY